MGKLTTLDLIIILKKQEDERAKAFASKNKLKLWFRKKRLCITIWLLNKVMSDGQAYLLYWALYNRKRELTHYAYHDKTADFDFCMDDINDIEILQKTIYKRALKNK